MRAGYGGRVAWIDLTAGKVRIEELDEGVARKYLGGKGLGAYLLHGNLRPQVHPYDPENILIFVTGPLTGTPFPAVSRSAVVTKSPMTGTFLDSYAGGAFGPRLKRAGYDALVVQGRAKRPVYILVDDGKISVREAEHLWGRSTSDTEDRLREELAQPQAEKMNVAAIGEAGERLVRFANIETERRAYGRGGAGAVMGSKNLKAVAVRGNHRAAVGDAKGFQDVVKHCQRKIREHPLTRKGGVFPRIGTMMTVDITQETGTLPTRNWQENTFDFSTDINGDAFLQHHVRSRACFACPIGCSRDLKAMVGGVEFITEGPDYETIYAFGSNCGIGDTEVIIAADKLCDEYGMDTISCGISIGFAMECFEKGLISEKETGGLPLTFGRGDILLELIRLIAKKEGIGRLLCDGVKIASEKVKGSSPFAMHIKGLELPGYDPRGMKGQALTYALSDRGACHVRSSTLRTELLGRPQKIDRYAYEGKAAMVRELQLHYAAFDCLIACLFGTFAISLQDYAEALSCVTGWPITLSELRTVAERAWNLTRLFNVREGFSREDDTLPERLFAEAASKGPSRGQVVDRSCFERMLDEYYQIAGWDESGIPTREKLGELGIAELA